MTLYLFKASTVITTYVAAENEEDAMIIAQKSWEREIGDINWGDNKIAMCRKAHPDEVSNTMGNAYYDEHKYGPNLTFPLRNVADGIDSVFMTHEVRDRIKKLEEELAFLKRCHNIGE